MIYAFIVGALSLAGAALPLYRKPDHAQLQIYLSAAAGALLGAAFFHLLPESSEHIRGSFGLPAVLGVGLVFLLQRYLAPHSHEPPHDHAVEHGVCEHGHEHRHDHSHDRGHHSMVGSGSIVGVVALSIHSFFDGVAIAAVSVDGGYAALAVFLSVLIHKPMDGLSVSVLLMNAKAKPKTLWGVQIMYALLVPVGALAFFASKGAVANPSTLVGYTLAFSAGTFLAIALTDLLPEIQFHAHDRHKLSGAVGVGLAVMWITSLIGHPAGHEHAQPNQPAGVTHDDHADHGH